MQEGISIEFRGKKIIQKVERRSKKIGLKIISKT
jgi:hypothetical protein